MPLRYKVCLTIVGMIMGGGISAALTLPAGASSVSTQKAANVAAAEGIAESAFYVAHTSDSKTVTATLYASTAKASKGAGVTSVTLERPGVALFTFKTGPAVCVTTTSLTGNPSRVITCRK
jgi:cytochrome oxidase Cu insertion factor (SCO1/SenC/PrrC family)